MKLQDAKRWENHSPPSRSFQYAGKHAGSRLGLEDSLHRIPGKRKSKTHSMSRGMKLCGALAGLQVIRCGWSTGMGKRGCHSLLRLKQGFSSSPFSHLGLDNSLLCIVQYSATSITLTTRSHYHHPPHPQLWQVMAPDYLQMSPVELSCFQLRTTGLEGAR